MTHIIMAEEIKETNKELIVKIGEIIMNKIKVGQNMKKITGEKF